MTQGYEKVVGPDHPRSQGLQDKLGTLDAIIGDKALAVVEDSERPLHLCGKETPSKSKRSKLFRKLTLYLFIFITLIERGLGSLMFIYYTLIIDSCLEHSRSFSLLLAKCASYNIWEGKPISLATISAIGDATVSLNTVRCEAL
jgi:hypothetical protein